MYMPPASLTHARVFADSLLANSITSCVRSARTKLLRPTNPVSMPSSKGKPTDPELREQLKEGE